MPTVTLVDTPNASMWYYPEKKIVHHKINKFIFGEEFHGFLLEGTRMFKENGARKWLSDDRNNTALRKEDIEWGQTNWFPQTVQAGWKYWAIVQPEKMIAQLNMEKLAEQYAAAGVITRFFTDPDEAMKWLESQP